MTNEGLGLVLHDWLIRLKTKKYAPSFEGQGIDTWLDLASISWVVKDMLMIMDDQKGNKRYHEKNKESEAQIDYTLSVQQLNSIQLLFYYISKIQKQQNIKYWRN